MKRSTGAVVLAGTLALSGCLVRATPTDVPAVLTNPTGRTHVELARVVSRAMNGAPVRLADSALTSDDELIVDRVVRRDAQGRELNGREIGRPEHFRLVKSGSRCVLVHGGTGRRWTLHGATCAPR
jgi:hypothetical protein